MATNWPEVGGVRRAGQRFRSRLFGRRGATDGQSEGPYGQPGKGNTYFISVITGIVLLALWYVATNRGWVPPLFLPSPEVVIDRLVALWFHPYAGGTLPQHIARSAERVFAAFFLACLLAIPTGITMSLNRIVRGVCDPMIEFYRPIPPLAYLPLTIIWLGIGEVQKVTLIYLAVFAPVVLSTRAGVRSVAISQIQVAYSLGANRWQVIWHVILKAALPEILTGMRVGIGFGWTTLVAAEMVAASLGIGHMVLMAAQFLNTAVVVIGVIIIGIIAFSFDLLMRYVERLLVPWKGRM